MLLDLSAFPVVLLRCPEKFTAATVTALAAEYEKAFERREPFVVVCDLRPIAEVPDALVRKALAEMLNSPKFKERHDALQLGSANVIASAGIRAALTALLWLWRPASPMVSVATIEEGVAWARQQLGAKSAGRRVGT